MTWDFSEGLARVGAPSGSNNGFIDKTGMFVIPKQFGGTEIGPDFSEGLAVITVDEISYGYIDTSGNIAIDAIYEGADKFSEGLAPVRINGKWGYIDVNGNIVIEPKFKRARPFNEGLAGVWREDDTTGFIDRTGEYVIGPCNFGAWEFSEGMGRIMKDAQAGFIDKNGEVVIEPLFEHAEPFSEGLALVRIGQKYLDKLAENKK